MPTENRSNDADGWIACDDGLHLIQMDKNLSHYGWVFRKVDGGLPYSVREATAHEMAHAQARQHLRIGVAQIAGQAPAPQPHPEPIAWMVGTAIWWTKEEAERDAAATGMPTVGLGPMNDRAAIELAESETLAAMAELAECETMADMVAEREWAEHVGTGDVSSKVEAAFTQLHNDLHETGEKLAERDALLARVVKSGALSVDQFEALEAECCALSASAPKCKTCHDQGEVFVRKADVHYGMQTEPEPVMAQCPECAEPSETAERDERTEFEAEWRKRYPDHPPLALKRSGLDLADYCNTRTKDAWWAWQARAALERKP